MLSSEQGELIPEHWSLFIWRQGFRKCCTPHPRPYVWLFRQLGGHTFYLGSCQLWPIWSCSLSFSCSANPVHLLRDASTFLITPTASYILPDWACPLKLNWKKGSFWKSAKCTSCSQEGWSSQKKSPLRKIAEPSQSESWQSKCLGRSYNSIIF